MSTHDTDHEQELDHAEENDGADSEGDEVAQEQADEAEPVEGYFERDDATGDGDAEGLADPDADVAEEADTFAADDVDEADEGSGEAIALGPVDADDTDDESVLLTESEPGSVLPPEEPEEPEEPTEPEAVPEPEPSPAALLEPVGADAALDPGTGTYQERWSAVQGAFVDEPLRAVESAGALVAQVWHDFERSMADQRDALDNTWTDASTTDDLRASFKQYRTMFTRLTTLLDTEDTP